MDERRGGAERHLVNRLTVSKLALQLLQRQTTLSAEQQGLVEHIEQRRMIIPPRMSATPG